MDLIDLHVLPEQRRAVFAAPDAHFGYDHALKTHATLTPAAATAILQSDAWHAFDFAGYNELLSKRLGVDFSRTIDVLRNVPLVNEGAHHKEIRRDLATLLARELPAIEAGMPALIERLLAPLRSSDRIDLVAEVIVPLVAELNLALCGVAAPPPAPKTGVTVSRIFDQLLGVTARSEIEEGLKLIAASVPDGDSVAALRAMVLNTLGADTLAGALSVTLHEALARQPGRKLSAIDYPQDYVATSVPFVGRRAIRDNEILGTQFAENDVVRVYMLAFTDNEADRDPSKVFGAGRHLCIGKRLSLFILNELTAALSRIDREVAVTDYRLRAGDYLFVFPERLEISLS